MRKIRGVKTELEENVKLQNRLKAEITTTDDRQTVSSFLRHDTIFLQDDIAQDVTKLLAKSHEQQTQMTKECESILNFIEQR